MHVYGLVNHKHVSSSQRAAETIPVDMRHSSVVTVMSRLVSLDVARMMSFIHSFIHSFCAPF